MGKKDLNPELGRRIRERLAALGKTQRGLAAHCGVSPEAVRQWINGKKPTDEHLEKAAQYLECSAPWLRYGIAPEAGKLAAKLAALMEARHADPDQVLRWVDALLQLTGRQRNEKLAEILELRRQNEELLRELEHGPPPRLPPPRRMLTERPLPQGQRRKKVAK